MTAFFCSYPFWQWSLEIPGENKSVSLFFMLMFLLVLVLVFIHLEMKSLSCGPLWRNTKIIPNRRSWAIEQLLSAKNGISLTDHSSFEIQSPNRFDLLETGAIQAAIHQHKSLKEKERQFCSFPASQFTSKYRKTTYQHILIK